jgi:integrase
VTARRGRGEGSIQQRKDGSWAAVVDLGWTNGKRTRKTVYGPTRKDVARQLTDLLKTRKDGMPIPVGTENVDAFLARWLDATKPTVRPRTWQRYEQYVRLHAAPALGRVRLSNLGPHHLQALYAERLEAGFSAQTVVHLHRMLHRALSQAVRWGLVARNVTELVDPPRVPRKEMRALSPDEARRLLHAAQGNRFEALYTVAVTTGMREGELLGLRWRDVDLDGRRLHVVGSLQNIPGEGWTIVEPKTARSRRVVVLGGVGTNALRRHRAIQAEQRLRAGDEWVDKDLVFPNRFGKPMLPSNLLIRSFHPLLAKANLPRVRFHDLRHTAASLLLDQGIHPKIVSEMLGHSAVGITLDLYSHVTPSMQHQAADALDALFGRNSDRRPGLANT